MAYLIDTNVLSEVRKPVADPGVAAWIADTPVRDQYLSVLTIGEIGRGVARLQRRRDAEQARIFETWKHDVLRAFADRILPVTVDVAEAWSRQEPSRPASTVDALIAATAQVGGLTLVTRNVRDFRHIDVALHNPFSEEGG